MIKIECVWVNEVNFKKIVIIAVLLTDFEKIMLEICAYCVKFWLKMKCRLLSVEVYQIVKQM